jgi:hypothetical protein
MNKDDKYKINSDLFLHFDELKKYFSEYSKDIADSNDPKIFDKVVKATIVKSFEFNLHLISGKDDQIFFMIPMLRGICEEFIVEKFIFSNFSIEKDSLLFLWMEFQRLKSSIAQWKYFETSKPNQILYYKESFPSDLKNVEIEIKAIFEQKFPRIRLNPFPSVYFMADNADLIELYNYLYHATSTFVHFHPGNLLRTGWGDLPAIQFSTKHFGMYYNYFTVFYSTVLFCKLAEWQISNDYLKNFNINNIKAIMDTLSDVSRQPEIVTFDEMNIEALSRHLFYTSPGKYLKGQNIGK